MLGRTTNVRAVVLASLLGCACGAQPAASTSTTTTASSSTTPADYEVHEWGLVRAEPGDVLRAGAIAPPVSTQPMVVLKPVLYFHAPSPLTLDSVVVRAAPGASLTEVWPLAPFDTTVRWENVVLDPNGACEPSALPTATDPPCATLTPGDLCEASSLAVARTSDGACVTVGASVDRFLFYRARVTRLTPPLMFERTSVPDQVRITHGGTLPIPGRVVRIRSSSGVVQALAVDPPTPGASIEIGASFEESGGVAAGRVGLRSSMLAIGLTEPEADAFFAAWDEALFGAPVALDLSMTAPVESFVYLLPEPTADEIATVELDPPPRTVHRAMAVWSVLAASGPSH
jgi:hypothetical protein